MLELFLSKSWILNYLKVVLQLPDGYGIGSVIILILYVMNGGTDRPYTQEVAELGSEPPHFVLGVYDLNL